MISFKKTLKIFIFKVVPIVLVGTLVLESIAYAMDLDTNCNLRVMLSGDAGGRVKKVYGILINKQEDGKASGAIWKKPKEDLIELGSFVLGIDGGLKDVQVIDETEAEHIGELGRMVADLVKEKYATVLQDKEFQKYMGTLTIKVVDGLDKYVHIVRDEKGNFILSIDIDLIRNQLVRDVISEAELAHDIEHWIFRSLLYATINLSHAPPQMSLIRSLWDYLFHDRGFSPLMSTDEKETLVREIEALDELQLVHDELFDIRERIEDLIGKDRLTDAFTFMKGCFDSGTDVDDRQFCRLIMIALSRESYNGKRKIFEKPILDYIVRYIKENYPVEIGETISTLNAKGVGGMVEKLIALRVLRKDLRAPLYARAFRALKPNNMTEQEFGDRVGMSQTEVSRCLHGERRPPHELWLDMVRFTGMGTKELGLSNEDISLEGLALLKYIYSNFENETDFAEKEGVNPNTVVAWIYGRHEIPKKYRRIIGKRLANFNKLLKTKKQWTLEDLDFINFLLKNNVACRLIAVQLLSMLGVHNEEVHIRLEKIRDEDSEKTVRQKAQSVLDSYMEVLIGDEIEIDVPEGTNIRELAVAEAKKLGVETAEVYFETKSEGDLDEATFAVYSLSKGDYIDINQQGKTVKKLWGNIVSLDDDAGKNKDDERFAHPHIVFINSHDEPVGGHLQSIRTKGKLIIRPVYGVHIGRDYDVVRFGRKFDPWKLTKVAVPNGVRGKRGAVIRLNDGEDLGTKIREVMKKLGIQKARFRVIGACQEATFVNSKTNQIETRKVYHEYLAEGTFNSNNEAPLDITIYLADEDGKVTEGKLVRLSNIALGEVVLEEDKEAGKLKPKKALLKTLATVLFTGILLKAGSLFADTIETVSKTGDFNWGVFFIVAGVVGIGTIVALIKIIRYIKNKEQRRVLKLYYDTFDEIPDGEKRDTSTQIARDSHEYESLIKSRVAHFKKFYSRLDITTILSQFFRHKNRDVRHTALDILAEFMKQDGATWIEIGLVMERLSDKDLAIRKCAIDILGSLEKDLSKVGFGLKEKVVIELKKQHEDPDVQQNVIDALKKIQPSIEWGVFISLGLGEFDVNLESWLAKCIILGLIVLIFIPFWWMYMAKRATATRKIIEIEDRKLLIGEILERSGQREVNASI